MARAWIQLDQEPAANWPMTLYYLGGGKAIAGLGGSYGPVVLIYRGRSVRECVAKGGFTRGGRRVLEHLDRHPKFVRQMWRQTRTRAARLLATTRHWPDENFSSWSTAKLARSYDTWCTQALDVLSVSTYGTVLEFEEPLLSGPVAQAITNQLPATQRGTSATLFATLTTPMGPNENRDAEQKLIELALRFRGREDTAALRALESWHRRYGYLRYGYSGPEKQFPETLREFREFKRKRLDVLRRERRALREADQLTRAAQRRALRLLHADRTLARHITTLRELAGLKRWRKKVMVRCQARAHPLLQAIAKRLDVPLIAAQSLAPWEVRSALLRGIPSRAVIRRRAQGVVVWIVGQRWRTLSAALARKIVREIDHSLHAVPKVAELTGMSACPGIARGTVAIMHDAADLKKFHSGDIIVSPATSPELVPAMRRAGAIVTDAGGITSHAAIVSREMKKPCVIGTKHATRVFKDGDRVEVDATKGTVKKISS